MEISYCDLKQNEVINVTDGKRMGRIVDLIISLDSCRVLGVVVPSVKKLFKSKEDIFIPWKNIRKIGDDVILICLTECNFDNAINPNKKPPPPPPPPRYYQTGSDDALFAGATSVAFSEADE